MPIFASARISRRHLLAAGASAAALSAVPAFASNHRGARYTLTAKAGTAHPRGRDKPATPIWGFEGQAPGPVLRVRQGERLDVTLVNRLPQPTTIHWHGIRLPNDMDGVPGVTQDAVMPGERFHYSFRCDDAGTYWYHPHANSAEQLGRGLWGVLVVEEPTPPRIDRELIWVLSDWKLREDGTLDPNFADRLEATHEGRIGQTLTINGAPGGIIPLRRNERIRLRLLNAANARIFELGFGDPDRGHDPWLIALDGHPAPPRRLAGDHLLLAPGMRADLLFDATGAEKADHAFISYAPDGDATPLARFAYDESAPLRAAPLPAPAPLAPNPVAEPVLSQAERHMVVFAGGAQPGQAMPGMPGMPMPPQSMPGQGMPAPAPPPGSDPPHPHGTWTINGKAMFHDGLSHDHAAMTPLLTLSRGAHVVFTLKNDTTFEHPIHLHGHTFRILSRDGKPVTPAPLTDTILMPHQETAEIAFVADNPGNWMLHCHILEHQAFGMGAIIRVTA